MSTSPAVAQDGQGNDDDVIVITGIRGSLAASQDVKRNAVGVVDAITAEDIGKFPDSNLAESLQRITGVSINRVNGEGSQVTVRGFGPGFNQVTLNGRTMPTADIPLVGGDGSGTGGDGRAFDFSNLASEGVSSLEVYKTGRASIASGGIGATVNIATRKPLDAGEGIQGSVVAKGLVDTSVDRGDDITPEIAGLMTWANPEETFGIGLFGSYSRRDSAAASATSASWNIETAGNFLDTANGRVSASTVLNNAPTDPSTLVALPRDSRYHFSEITRERINGQLVMQFNPREDLRFTADYTFATNEAEEARSDVSNWFNRPFSEVTFAGSPVATTVFLAEELTSPKDLAMQQTIRATKDELSSFGFNGEWDVSDRLTVIFDAHSSKAEVSPDAPMGYSEINVGMAMPVVIEHSVDYSGDLPVQTVITDDSISSNGDGILDANDISTQVSNLRTVSQKNEIEQFDLRANYALDENVDLTFGANYRSQSNETSDANFRQILGDWGATNPGDVEQLLPGALTPYCLSCEFDDFSTGNVVNGFRGDAAAIFAAVSPFYDGQGNPLNTLGNSFDKIEEDVLAVFAEIDMDLVIADRDAHINLGVRYEETDVTSSTSSVPTAQIVWQGDNDFNTIAASSGTALSLESSYDNFLPNADFSIDVTENVVARASFSRTIARAGYNNLFASDSVNTPSGPTAFGNVPTGTKGNPGLLPLESDNFDVSVEWYYQPDSYVSVGVFEKRVRNFVGIGQTTQSLFDLRDPTSGAAGSRSGDALDLLGVVGADPNDRNLFAMTALIQTEGSLAAAQAVFEANQAADGNIDDAFYLQLETDVDIEADANDPLFEFELTQPINNEEAKINGVEIAGQHFFGDSGFGIAGSYTLVDGDVGFDVGGDPSVDQFALTGLSDTANLTLIYEDHGLSARLAYNFREDFLFSANRGGGFRNPVFVEEIGQFDVNISYDVNDQLALSLEAINLTGEDLRVHGRDVTNLWFAQELHPRYYLGARYKF